MPGREFRITVHGRQIQGEIFTPGIEDPEPCGNAPLVTEPHLATVKVLAEWLKRWQMLTRLQEQERVQDNKLELLVPGTFDLLGAHLWKMAFVNDIGAALIRHYKMIRDGSLDYVRVLISFAADPEIAALPWEFLYHPAESGIKGFYLASEAELILGRYVHGVENRKIPLADKKVRVLFATSLPMHRRFQSARADAAKLIRRLKIGKRTGEAMQIERVDSWDVTRIDAALQMLAGDGHQVDVVHLTALFRIRENKMQVYLPDPYAVSIEVAPDGDSHSWQPAATFVNVLTGLHKPSLLVLALCDWEGVFPEHFEQLAPDFINAGIPAVLAMQYPMSSRQELEFLTSFYAKLTEGAPIGKAVQNGRRDMFLLKVDRNFGTPVLYMQSELDAQLMNPTAPPDTEVESENSTRGVIPQQRASTRSSRETDVRGRMLDAIATVSHLLDPGAVQETRQWIEGANWSEVKAARRAIQERSRERKPEDTFQMIALHLLKVLGDETAEAAS